MSKRLNAVALESRLRLDERTMAQVNVDPAPIRVSGHESADDARSGAKAIAPGSGRAPEHYRVVYEFETLSGRGRRHRPVVVHIDLLANGNYPFSEPVCRTVGNVTPWTPHFMKNYPICIGDGWPNQSARDAGQTLAVDLVVHIAKLLNFDEPPPKPGYHGYNGAAIEWWLNKHGGKPLNPDLRYPIIDPNAAVGASGPRFGPASPHGGVGRFTPAGPRATGPGRFAPAGGSS